MDELYLQRALILAEQAIGLSSPNPRVGCVLVKDGAVLGEGHTQAAGQAHAEVMAIRDAQTHGRDVSGCTVYVSLEPCSHFGRTPPCVDALKAIAPARVVVAVLDANPQVAGSGIAALREAGVEVAVLAVEHPLAQAAFELNIGFNTRMSTGKVFTRLKWAASADFKTALPDGHSQWITGALARLDGHGFRARADVIVSGIGTVLQDNPQLNARGVHVAKPAVKCIIDSAARTPIAAAVFNDGAPVCLVVADLNADDGEFELQNERLHQLRAAHPQLQVLSMPPIGLSGRIDLTALWAYFSEQQYNEIHVEAGGVLNAALLEAQLVDELLMYVAPRIIGAGKTAAAFGADAALDDLTQRGAWRWLDAVVLEDDMRLRLRRL